jgi:3',5'-cyclic AMP phosphodiesterase CpdA
LDIHALDPEPDFVVFGGDLGHLGDDAALKEGAELLGTLRAPLRCVAGEHDIHADGGALWRSLFGDPTYTFAVRGTHFLVLNSSLIEGSFSGPPTSADALHATVAGLANDVPGRFGLGPTQLQWVRSAVAGLTANTPLVLLSHVPLFDLRPEWRYGIAEADALAHELSRFESVLCVHAHVHRATDTTLGRVRHVGLPATAFSLPDPQLVPGGPRIRPALGTSTVTLLPSGPRIEPPLAAGVK